MQGERREKERAGEKTLTIRDNLNGSKRERIKSAQELLI